MKTMTIQEFAKLLTSSNTTQHISDVEIIQNENTAKEIPKDSLRLYYYDIECMLDVLCLRNVTLTNVKIRFKRHIELTLTNCKLSNVKLFDNSKSTSTITIDNYSTLTNCIIHSFAIVNVYYTTLQYILMRYCISLRIYNSKLDNCNFAACVSRVGLVNSIFTNCRFIECTFRAYNTRNVEFDNCEYKMSPCFYQHCPETGSYIAYKKARSIPDSLIDFCIVKLLIPEDAKRSSSFSSKCRASKAIVLDIFDLYDESKHLDTAYSIYDSKFVYHINDTVEVTDFDDNRWEECAPGIHHFLSKQEVINYSI